MPPRKALKNLVQRASSVRPTVVSGPVMEDLRKKRSAERAAESVGVAAGGTLPETKDPTITRTMMRRGTRLARVARASARQAARSHNYTDANRGKAR